jgi:hypothetical protein
MSSFDIGKFTNDSAKWLVSSPATVTFTSNAIYMALILTILALFIIAYMSDSRHRYVKTGIYLLIVNSFVIFIHHYALTAKITGQYKTKAQTAGDVPEEYKLTPTIGRGEPPIEEEPAAKESPIKEPPIKEPTNDDFSKSENVDTKLNELIKESTTPQENKNSIFENNRLEVINI